MHLPERRERARNSRIKTTKIPNQENLLIGLIEGQLSALVVVRKQSENQFIVIPRGKIFNFVLLYPIYMFLFLVMIFWCNFYCDWDCDKKYFEFLFK